MRLFCTASFLLVFTTASVYSDCLLLECQVPYVAVDGVCRSRRSPGDEGCYGRDKIYVNDRVFDNPGSYSVNCPDGYYFNREMQCAVEGWEPNSGPWETHHYISRGRNLVLEIKRSNLSVRVRSLYISQ